jgi:hypothetical protein
MNVKDLDIPDAVGSHVGVIGMCCNYRELISITAAVVGYLVMLKHSCEENG